MSDSLNHQNLEAMAKALEDSGQYRVIRKLDIEKFLDAHDGCQTQTGLFLDVETTGLDYGRDEVIEIAMVPFLFDKNGRIFKVLPTYQSFQEPRGVITDEITRLTGITSEMVRGHKINVEEVEKLVEGVDLIVAHNAGFDRRFAEKISPVFVKKPWACSMSQVDWKSFGFEGSKLSYLAGEAGFYYDRHRAENDCLAAIALLNYRLDENRRALTHLLEMMGKPGWRVWAVNSPFELKDRLKAAGYRWNADSSQGPRSWYKDITDDEKEREMAFLRKEIYQRDVDLDLRKITAYDRFSGRV